MSVESYSITFNLQLTPQEVESLYSAHNKGNVDLCRDRDTRAQVLKVLGGSHNQRAVIQKMRPVNTKQRVAKHMHKRLTYSESHGEKEAARYRSMQAVLKKPNYSYARYHHGLDVTGLHQWLNRKTKKMYHFRSTLWPVRGQGDASPITRNPEWRARNEDRARIEQFKAGLDESYPKMMDHTQCFVQRSHYPSGQSDFSRLFLIARPYDDDNKKLYPAGRRFSDAQFARLCHDCQLHGLRVIVEDRVYRKRLARFILIADSNVDLVQAYRFAIALPAM